MKIVINTCFGGFGLSDIAIERYFELNGISWKAKIKGLFNSHRYYYYSITEEELDMIDCDIEQHKFSLNYLIEDIDRTDPNLIKVVEELGRIANGSFSKLKIIEIPDEVDYTIDEYDGNEFVAERHRSWS